MGLGAGDGTGETSALGAGVGAAEMVGPSLGLVVDEVAVEGGTGVEVGVGVGVVVTEAVFLF